MTQDEKKPIDEITQATSVNGAKLLGIASDGQTRLFGITDIKGDGQGTAIAATDPGIPVLSQYYWATPGVTYPNFKDSTDEPIVVPTTFEGRTVINAKMTWKGPEENWELQFDTAILPPGPQGWTPVYAGVDDGARRVQRLTDFVGGTGVKPTDGIGLYVGPTGLVANIAAASDYRGPQGVIGVPGTANFAAYVAGAYTGPAQVNFLGLDWTLPAGVTASAAEIPGTSAKWVNRIPGYSSKNEAPSGYYGPYASLSAACLAIPNDNVLIDGVLKNRREGKVVGVIRNGLIQDYTWNGGFADSNLIKVRNMRTSLDNQILRNKYRQISLPSIETWTWTNGISAAGVPQVIGGMPVWQNLTDGWISIPLTIDPASSKFLGLIFECIALRNVDNFMETNAYLRVNGNNADVRGFSKIKFEKIGSRLLYTASFNLANLQPTDTVDLYLATHVKNRPTADPIVAELSHVSVFYIDDTITDGIFTVLDFLTKVGADLVTLAGRVTNNEASASLLAENKITKRIGENKLNPAAFRYGNFYYSGQNGILQYNGANSFGCTDYIPADPAGLITTGTGRSVNGLSSYAVFGATKNWIRNGQDTDQYLYQSGDGFVVFVYPVSGNLSFADSKAVFSGTVYKTFEVYTEYKPLGDLAKTVATLSIGQGVLKILNGTPVQYGNVSNFTGPSITQKNVADDYLVYSKTGLGNSWILTPVFSPSGSNLVHIRFKVEFTKTATTKGFNILVANQPNTAGGAKYISVGKVTENGTYNITFDPAYFSVYQEYTQFYVWINNEGMEGAGSVLTAKFTNLQVVEYSDSVNAVNFTGDNAKELFQGIDNSLTQIKSTLAEAGDVVISPNGTKFVPSVLDNGTFTLIPVVPNTAAFFGNSLIGGFGFGMAASDTTKDYYYLVTEFIKTLKPTFTNQRLGAANFESIENPALVDAAIQTQFIDKLTGAEQLILVQLGDNVNTDLKNAVFVESCPKLLKALRIKCPNARIFWVGMWYGTTAKYQVIQNACVATGCTFISLADLAAEPANQAKVGYISKRGTATKTLAGVTNVVETTPGNIKVTFTVGSSSYESAICPVTSYSLASGTLTYSGEYYIIPTTGEASHPWDPGFRLIANRILYRTKITNDIEQYKAV